MSKDPASTPVSARAIDLLGDLVAFDTTSRRSNLELIDFVEAYLGRLGVAAHRVSNDDGAKASLFASIGPATEGGVVLSGHTDVVPVDGQPWTSDPFRMCEQDGRLYGRGTCDMKGFLALCLAAVPEMQAAPLKRPVHLAFSYDEEVGCLGAPDLIAALARSVPAPAAVIVGEPTSMQVVGGHKGIAVYRITVTGQEAHSSLTHLGVSANMEAIKLLSRLDALAEQLKAMADPGSIFTPKETTLTVGLIAGGTAGNILARECSLLFDVRTVPGHEPQALLAEVFQAAAALDAELKSRFPGAGVKIEACAHVPPLSPEPLGAADHLARRLAADNGPARAVSYGAEAGQFQRAGLSTIICGPGSIEQAHQADEYIDVEQMLRGAAFMSRLTTDLAY